MTTIICTTVEMVVIYHNYVHRHATPAGLLTSWPDLHQLVNYYHADVLILNREPEPHEACEDSGWGTVKHEDLTAGYLHVGYMPRLATGDLLLQHVAGDHASRLMLDDDTDDGCLSLITGRLGVWNKLTGVDYHTHPAVSAIVSMKRWVHKAPKWILKSGPGEHWTPPGPLVDIRTDTYQPAVTWDRRAAYLASAAAVDLPYKMLPHTGYDYDPKCGYYRVAIDDSELGAYFRQVLRESADGTVWVCHPTLRVLEQTGTLVQVVDSYSTAEAMRILRPWAEKWRDALNTVTDPELRGVLKKGYAQALGGLLAVKTGTVYRPDWRHMIIDHNRAHTLRIVHRMWQAGYGFPIDINIDAITYNVEPSDAIDQLVGVGPNIGNMRTATTGIVKQLTVPGPMSELERTALTAFASAGVPWWRGPDGE